MQFKKKKRSANLRKNDNNSSEDDVTVVTNEAKKVKTVVIWSGSYVGEYDDVHDNVDTQNWRCFRVLIVER